MSDAVSNQTQPSGLYILSISRIIHNAFFVNNRSHLASVSLKFELYWTLMRLTSLRITGLFIDAGSGALQNSHSVLPVMLFLLHLGHFMFADGAGPQR